MTALDPRQRAWVEVAPRAIEANARTLCDHLGSHTTLMAVVKADGYGHGAETVARSALRGGATSLGVATLAEGLELRRAGLDVPILLLGNLTEVDQLRTCLDWRLMPTLSRAEDIKIAQHLASDSGRRFAVQLKLDTGMTRLGCAWQEGPELVDLIHGQADLQLCGLYSHLACADGDPNGDDGRFTELQQQRFKDVIDQLPGRGQDLCCHLANSAGTLQSRDLHHDMVRVGLALYGHPPADHLAHRLNLQPALSVKARVTFLRTIEQGVGASYGRRFISQRPSRLAVVAIGYADGVVRALSNRIDVLHQGQRLRQVGAITMDQLLVDVTDAPDVRPGDIVTLLGVDGNQAVTPQDWSTRCDSIPWEILCGFKRRLPRVEI